MKIVFHIGTPKTGTTTIQRLFEREHDALLRCGVLYPVMDGRGLHPKLLRFSMCEDTPTDDMTRLLDSIDAQIRQHKPDVLVLSTEEVWSEHKRLETLKSRLEAFGTDVSFQVYLRDPAGFFRSMQQQYLKSTHRLFSPVKWRANYDGRLSAWNAAFPGVVTATAFQKSSLHDADVVTDLVTRHFPQALGQFDAGIKNANSAELAEVSSIVQKMFLALYPDADRTYRPDINAAKNRLTDVALELGVGSKSQLRPAVEETILAANSRMLQTLKQIHGIVFDAVDYALLPQMKIHQSLGQPASFADLCDVNPDVETLIMAKAFQTYLGQPRSGAKTHKPDLVADLRALQRRLGKF